MFDVLALWSSQPFLGANTRRGLETPPVMVPRIYVFLFLIPYSLLSFVLGGLP